MKHFRLILFLLFVFGSDLLFAQKGVYVLRDSTLNLPVGANYNTIIGTKSGTAFNYSSGIGGNIESGEYGSPIDIFTKNGENNTFIGSYAAFNKSPIQFSSNFAGSTIIGAKAAFQLGETSLHQATIIGAGAGYNSYGKSVLIGYQAGFGNNAVSDYYSVLIGNRAGYKGGAGWGSTFIGYESGFNSLTSADSPNTFVGYKSGYNITTGSNVGLGYAVATGSVGSGENIFLGAFAGYNGNHGNVQNGASASALAIPFKGGNVLIGAYSGKVNNGNANTFVGRYSGIDNTSGYKNVFLGFNSGVKNKTGFSNTFIGFESGVFIKQGERNTFIGNSAGVLEKDSVLINATAIGNEAKVSANNSLILGGTGGNSINVGIGNTAPTNRLEITSAATNTSGLRFTNLKSTSIPSTANNLGLSVDANGDVILVPSGGNNGVYDQSFYIPSKPLNSIDNVNKFNCFVGIDAGKNQTTSFGNTFLGSNAGQNNTVGNLNTLIGGSAGGAGITTQGNTFLGNAAGYDNTGAYNTYLGLNAGRGLLNTQSSICVGNSAGSPGNIAGGGTQLSRAVLLGESTAVLGNLSNVSAIGSNAMVSANNSLILGSISGINGANASTNVGIGNTAPQNRLEITSAATNTSGLRFTNLKSTSTPSTSNSLSLSVDTNGDVILVPAGGGTLPQGADVWDQLSNGADYLIRNKNNKSVMIGTVAAAKTSIDYKLYVEKGILSEKVKVSAQANWPDYVFGKDYSLMPLKEVENYITTNNHLPEVPSAEVIAKEGLDLGKMDATLLKKVEELTLYLIEQSKQLSAQQQSILKLQEKINSIEKAKK